MSNNEQKLMLICFTFREGDHLTKGKPGQCMRCGETVWISDSSISRIEANFPKVDFIKDPLEIYCTQCAEIKIKQEQEDVLIVPPTREQLEEIRQVLNKDNPNVN